MQNNWKGHNFGYMLYHLTFTQILARLCFFLDSKPLNVMFLDPINRRSRETVKAQPFGYQKLVFS